MILAMASFSIPISIRWPPSWSVSVISFVFLPFVFSQAYARTELEWTIAKKMQEVASSRERVHGSTPLNLSRTAIMTTGVKMLTIEKHVRK